MAIFAHAGTEVLRRPVRTTVPWWQADLSAHIVGRIVMWLAFLILGGMVALGLFATIPMIWGYHPVFGPSMQPTLPLIGGNFHMERLTDPAKQLRVNDLVALRGQTLGWAVKRVAEVRHDGLIVRGDNTDHSMDSTFGADNKDEWRQVVIPYAEVAGRANDIWSPKRMWRSLATSGRFENRLELEFAPRDKYLYQSWAVTASNGTVQVWTPSQQTPVFSMLGTAIPAGQGTVIATNENGTWTISSAKAEKTQAELKETSKMSRFGKKQLLVDGDVRQTVRPGVKLRVGQVETIVTATPTIQLVAGPGPWLYTIIPVKELPFAPQGVVPIRVIG